VLFLFPRRLGATARLLIGRPGRARVGSVLGPRRGLASFRGRRHERSRSGGQRTEPDRRLLLDDAAGADALGQVWIGGGGEQRLADAPEQVFA